MCHVCSPFYQLEPKNNARQSGLVVASGLQTGWLDSNFGSLSRATLILPRNPASCPKTPASGNLDANPGDVSSLPGMPNRLNQAPLRLIRQSCDRHVRRYFNCLAHENRPASRETKSKTALGRVQETLL
jgi:hypothetical protein